jgi:hypothetical protein
MLMFCIESMCSEPFVVFLGLAESWRGSSHSWLVEVDVWRGFVCHSRVKILLIKQSLLQMT